MQLSCMAIGAVTAFALDQISKVVVVHWLDLASIHVIPVAPALDRAIYGTVADFLNMSCCGIRNPYSFNVADVFIFLGVGLVIVSSRRKGWP